MRPHFGRTRAQEAWRTSAPLAQKLHFSTPKSRKLLSDQKEYFKRAKRTGLVNMGVEPMTLAYHRRLKAVISTTLCRYC